MTEEKQPVPRGSRILMWILIILGISVVACGLFAGGLFYAVLRVTAPAAETARTYLEAVGDKDYSLAFDLLSVRLQDEFETADGFAAEMQERRIAPVEVGTFTSRSIENDVATIVGPVTFADTAMLTATTNLRYSAEREMWVVAGFSFE